MFAGFMVAVLVIFSILLTRLSRPVWRAVAEGRPLEGSLRSLALAGPWLNALVSLLGWVLAAVVFPLYSALRLDNSAVEVGLLSVVLVLGGLTTMALVYLLGERALRPLIELAFRERPPDRVRAVAVRPRLLLTWALGGAVPLVLVVVALFSPAASRDDLRVSAVAIAAIGLVAGATITARAARSVADPIQAVREAMARVRRGDLDATVQVDDATEIGLLQAGFNDMVTGLRERDRLRDLFGRHVGEEVAEQAMAHGVALGGEVRPASALFVDLTASTHLAATRPATEVVALLNDFFAVVVAVVEREGGLVNKFEGDAALCIFGAPVPHADHAARALRSARALRDELAALRRRHAGLDAGIGVSTGDVVAGHVGAERRFEYTVIGDPVNEAARLTDEAKHHDGRVLASEAAVDAAGEEASHWRQVGVLALRGRPEPTCAYEPD